MNRYVIRGNIARHLVRKGWTQKQLAERIGLTESTMSRYMNGTRQPTAYALLRMSRAFGCTVDDLVQGLDDNTEVKHE